MDMMDVEDEESFKDMDGHLFEVRLPNGSMDSVVFTFINLDMEEQKGQGQIQEQKQLNKLRKLIHVSGGVELLEFVENYGYEIPILVIPSYEERVDLEVWKTKVGEKLNQRQRMKIYEDVFSSDFIMESIEHKTRLDLNEYRIGNSNFENYDANDVMNIKVKWSELKLKSNIANSSLRIVLSPKRKRIQSQGQVIGAESGTGIERAVNPNPSTPQIQNFPSNSKFRPIQIQTRNSNSVLGQSVENENNEDLGISRSTTSWSAKKKNNPVSVSKEIQVVPSRKRSSESPVPCSSSSMISKEPTKQIVGPPVSPIHSIHSIHSSDSSESKSDSDSDMIIYSDEDDFKNNPSSFNKKSKSKHSSRSSTSASVRKERTNSESSSTSTTPSPTPNSSSSVGVPQRNKTQGIKLVPARQAQVRTERRGRQPGTRQTLMTRREMQTVLDHICEKKLFGDVGGNEAWKKIEKRKIVANRSWHTLKNNFCRTILKKGNLETFNVSKEHYKILCRLRRPKLLEK